MIKVVEQIEEMEQNKQCHEWIRPLRQTSIEIGAKFGEFLAKRPGTKSDGSGLGRRHCKVLVWEQEAGRHVTLGTIVQSLYEKAESSRKDFAPSLSLSQNWSLLMTNFCFHFSSVFGGQFQHVCPNTGSFDRLVVLTENSSVCREQTVIVAKKVLYPAPVVLRLRTKIKLSILKTW